MQFRALRLIVHAFRINLGMHHLALYGLHIQCDAQARTGTKKSSAKTG